jgi:hypothetical protein
LQLKREEDRRLEEAAAAAEAEATEAMLDQKEDDF